LAKTVKELFIALSDPLSNPIQIIWDHFKEIWVDGAKKVKDEVLGIKEYYQTTGQKGSLHERQLDMVFFEIYEYLLEEVKKRSPFATSFPHTMPIAIVMDSLSLREATLLENVAQEEGYQIDEFSYAASAAPSDTKFFRQKVFLTSSVVSLRRRKEFETIMITHEEDLDALKPIKGPTLFWSSFPDNLLEESSLDYCTIFEKTTDTLASILRLKPDACILTSDHGYLAEAERWGLPSRHSRLMQKTFKASRWALKDNLDEEILNWILGLPKEMSYFVIDEKYVYIRGRYMWTTTGKRPASFHGGISPMEVLTPFIKLRRVK
jgi:hypothetical protein